MFLNNRLICSVVSMSECFGVDKASLTYLIDYLTFRKQRTKIGSSFSSLWDINTIVPQGSIVDPLLFSIFINELFIKKTEVCNFADDNTLFCGDKNLDLIFFNLNSDLINAMDWFKNNSHKANLGKLQFMVQGANKVLILLVLVHFGINSLQFRGIPSFMV